jgi:hypothetical protein
MAAKARLRCCLTHARPAISASDLGDSTCPLATRRVVGPCLLSALQHTCVPERRVFWHAGPLWNSGRLFLCPKPGERHRARTSRVRAHGPPRSGQRRIDLDASLAETVTLVQAWAAREHIALRGDEPDAPTLRLWGDAPAGRHGPGLLTDPAAFLPCLGFLASARLMPFGLSSETSSSRTSGMQPRATRSLRSTRCRLSSSSWPRCAGLACPPRSAAQLLRYQASRGLAFQRLPPTFARPAWCRVNVSRIGFTSVMRQVSSVD